MTPTTASAPTTTVTVTETLRDAWQGLTVVVPTDDKVRFVDRLMDAGMTSIDIGSFVSPTRVPAMRDTAEVLRRVRKPEGVRFVALVANERGFDDLLRTGRVDEVLFPFSLSETFQRRNTNLTREQALSLTARLTERAHENQRGMYVTVSMAFGNNEGDPFSAEELRDWVGRLDDAGVDRLALADTTAQASAATVQRVFQIAGAGRAGRAALGAHLHPAPGQQRELVDAALDAGCRAFDAALGDLGGCQFACAPEHNLSTLALVRQLRERGLSVAAPPLDVLEELDREARALAAGLRA
jgi:hydroxymethylglutaryl-CoA lyase